MNQEDFAQQIALATVSQIKEGTIQEMNESAEAWVKRSRNLAKLWFDRQPSEIKLPEILSEEPAPSQEEIEAQQTVDHQLEVASRRRRQK